MIKLTRVHAVASVLNDSLKLSPLDSLALAPHLVGGKRINLDDIAWLTLSEGNIVVTRRKKPGTDDGGDFETAFPLPERSVDREFVGRLLDGVTDDQGAFFSYSDLLTRQL